MDVQLTRRGRAIAIMVSTQRYEALTGAHVRFGEAYREFLKRHSLADLGLDAEFFDGLRDRREGRRVRL